jgi:hypothetical protein
VAVPLAVSPRRSEKSSIGSLGSGCTVFESPSGLLTGGSVGAVALPFAAVGAVASSRRRRLLFTSDRVKSTVTDESKITDVTESVISLLSLCDSPSVPS